MRVDCFTFSADIRLQFGVKNKTTPTMILSASITIIKLLNGKKGALVNSISFGGGGEYSILFLVFNNKMTIFFIWHTNVEQFA